jgi:hypothetical protein
MRTALTFLLCIKETYKASESMKSRTDTAICHVKAQEIPNITSFEDNLLVWTFRNGKEKNTILKYVSKCAGKSSFKNPSGHKHW